MAIIESLSCFVFVAYFPHILLYEFYLAFKYIILGLELYVGSRSYDNASRVSTWVGMIFTCCCCVCCCRQVPYEKFYIFMQNLNRFLVKILFGPKEGVVGRFAEYKKDEKDENGNSKLYLRNKELNYREISHFGLLIATFGLLSLVTAWDSYFLKESFVCTEQPDVNCFPIPIDDDAIEDFNLSDAQKQRIEDCTYWVSENVSDRVTFQCFQWVYDLKGVTSDVGGLLTIF